MIADLASTIMYLREINVASTILRLTLAIIFGGLIGLEREYKRRPAGFRTYMLVCLGAALTMLLSQYESLMLNTLWASDLEIVNVNTDVTRFGAQVINGVGFLGAGTIIFTSWREVKGLTTAAGLWASACMGLAIGAGFYECVILNFILIFLCIKVFPLIENAMMLNSRNINIYTEFKRMEDIGAIIKYVKAQNIQIFDVDIDLGENSNPENLNAVLSLYLPEKQSHTDVLAMLSGMKSIDTIKEI